LSGFLVLYSFKRELIKSFLRKKVQHDILFL